MCFIVPSGPAGCIASITRKQPNLTVFRPSPRRPAVVFGFVTRDAKRVAIAIGPKRYRAHLNGGLYWYQLPSPKSEALTVRVSYRDGDVVTTRVVAPPAPKR